MKELVYCAVCGLPITYGIIVAVPQVPSGKVDEEFIVPLPPKWYHYACAPPEAVSVFSRKP